MNYSDTERIASILDEIGFKECKTEKAADLIIFNTCSVKQNAENRIFGQMLKMQKLRNSNKDLVVAITGCMVRRSSHKQSEKPDKLIKKLNQLDLVFKIRDLPSLPKLIKEIRPKWFTSSQNKSDNLAQGEVETKVRAGLPKVRAGLPNVGAGLQPCSSKLEQSPKPKLEQNQMLEKLEQSCTLLQNVTKRSTTPLHLQLQPKVGAGLHPAPKHPNSTPSLTEYRDYFKTKPKYASKFQAFVPIMTGCDKFCSYCIVPFSRGREQSRPMEDIISECKNLVESGCKEITLLGQNVDSYGLSPIDFDSGKFNLQQRQKLGLRTNLKNPPFVKLLKKLDQLKTKGLCRLRYTSPHPYDMSEDLIKAHTQLKTLCEHIHLPIQSGDNEILKRMNRHYTVEHYLDLIKKIRKALPNIGLTTDIIVGFPGETEEQFENTYKLAEKVRWNMIFNSRYSPRRGTYSADKLKDDVPAKEKARRWHKLNDLLKVCSKEKNQSFLGKKVNVLVETCKGSTCIGRSREFIEVQFPGTSDLIGQEVDVTVKQAHTWVLEGRMGS